MDNGTGFQRSRDGVPCRDMPAGRTGDGL